MSIYWTTDEELLFRKKLINMVNNEFKMDHGHWVEISILDALLELNPDEIHEWVDKDLLPGTHVLHIGMNANDAMETLNNSPEHSALFPLDEEFFQIFWKSVCAKMAACCGCKRCGTWAEKNAPKSAEAEASRLGSPDIRDGESEAFIEGFKLGYELAKPGLTSRKSTGEAEKR